MWHGSSQSVCNCVHHPQYTPRYCDKDWRLELQYGEKAAPIILTEGGCREMTEAEQEEHDEAVWGRALDAA